MKKMMTKGKFLELLNSIDPDPAFITMIIKDCFKRLPDAVAWKLSHQLYMNYFWDGETYKIKSNLSGEEILFSSLEQVVSYLTKLGYKTTHDAVRRAFNERRTDYCNHMFFKDIKEEITYFE